MPNQPGLQDTGYTHLFAADSLDSNGVHILPAAYGDTVIHDCHYLEDIGKADQLNMPRATATYAGQGSSTHFHGNASDPLEKGAPGIDWDANVNVTQFSPTGVAVSGAITHDCYPAHEISVGSTDVYTFMPTSNDFSSVASCLAGFNSITKSFSKNITVSAN